MRKLTYSLRAHEDLRELADWLTEAGASDAAAMRLVEALIAQCERIADNPAILGRERDDLNVPLRSFPVLNHLIFFDYRSDGRVRVARIVHAARDLPTLFVGDIEALFAPGDDAAKD